jgi:phosphotransferase system  glucose/maltose/N-acetylglucosamine-specific IIC component
MEQTTETKKQKNILGVVVGIVIAIVIIIVITLGSKDTQVTTPQETTPLAEDPSDNIEANLNLEDINLDLEHLDN